MNTAKSLPHHVVQHPFLIRSQPFWYARRIHTFIHVPFAQSVPFRMVPHRVAWLFQLLGVQWLFQLCLCLAVPVAACVPRHAFSFRFCRQTGGETTASRVEI